jgi:hypothetical protein
LSLLAAGGFFGRMMMVISKSANSITTFFSVRMAHTFPVAQSYIARD